MKGETSAIATATTEGFVRMFNSESLEYIGSLARPQKKKGQRYPNVLSLAANDVYLATVFDNGSISLWEPGKKPKEPLAVIPARPSGGKILSVVSFADQ